MQLVRYETAKKALAEYKRVDDVKTFRDKAVAVQAYAKQAKDRELEVDASAARFRAERRLGELMKEQPNAKPPGDNQYKKQDRGNGRPEATLEEQGIDKHLAKAARTAAAIPEEEFEEIIDKHREKQEKVTAATVRAMKGAAVQYNSGENEWYTPPIYIEAARDVMGSITLDPASSATANKTVRARRFFSKDDDGLSKKWTGRVWMNPPYARELIVSFAEKLVESLPDIESAIVLVNNASDTNWFQMMAEPSDAVCFPSGRVRFLDPDGKPGAPLQGQTFFYFGSEPKTFIQEFCEFGVCWRG